MSTHARTIMTPHVTTVRFDVTLRDVAGLLMKAWFDGVPVVDDEGKLTGFLSDGAPKGGIFDLGFRGWHLSGVNPPMDQRVPADGKEGSRTRGRASEGRDERSSGACLVGRDAMGRAVRCCTIGVCNPTDGA